MDSTTQSPRAIVASSNTNDHFWSNSTEKNTKEEASLDPADPSTSNSQNVQDYVSLYFATTSIERCEIVAVGHVKQQQITRLTGGSI